MMSRPSKLTSKYQTTIPKEIRAKLNLEVGDYVQFREKEGEIVLTKIEQIDQQYLASIATTLESEWLSAEDEAAYADL